MININNLCFAYGSNKVLNNISFEMKDGRIYGILGENGVGKTTLLSLIAGLKNPMRGTINVNGQIPYERKPSFLSDIYYLCDEPSTMNCSAISYAENYGKFWNKFSVLDFKEIMTIFEMDVNQKMNQMSLGQLKKTHLSFALASHSKTLLMDEPTNGLDIPSKALFRKALMKFTSDDTTVIISTHQVRDLENIIDPIIILDRNDVLLNADIETITRKLFFDYGNELKPDSLYSEMIPGGAIQVYQNADGQDSKVNIEALFNATLSHKEFIKELFK